MFRGSAYSIETDKDLINNSEILEEQEILIALLGGPDVGKTSMLACIDNQPFHEGIPSTKILQPRFKKLRINKNCIINLYTWDSPGQRVSEYLHNGSLDAVDGFIEVFDLTDRHSFHTIEAIHYDLSKMRKRQKQGSPLCAVLVGNKADLLEDIDETDKQITSQTDYLADKLGKRQNLLYLKTSAKNNSFVKDSFVELIKQIIRVKKKGSHSSKGGINTNFSYVDYQEGEGIKDKCKQCCHCRMF